MVGKREDMEQLIVLFLSGEATPEQAMELNDWRHAHADNDALFKSLEHIYSTVNGIKAYRAANKDVAWTKLKSELALQPRIVPLWKQPKWYLAVAAIALIAFLIGSLWTNSTVDGGPVVADHTIDSTTVKPIILRANQHIALYTLDDQSTIRLEPGSSATLPTDFNQQHRRLKLSGSGEFDVVHNEQRPFTVEVEGLQVIDVGTVFHIQTQGDTVKVVVTEGEVQLKLNDRLLNVAEGDSAFYVISEQLVSRYSTPSARQDKVFEFKGTSLEEVAEILSKFFKRKIVVMDEAIANCKVSVTFKNENLATILDVLQELLDVKMIRNHEIIGIYGTGCN